MHKGEAATGEGCEDALEGVCSAVGGVQELDQ